jgi:hypothetical protein
MSAGNILQITQIAKSEPIHSADFRLVVPSNQVGL